jgi:DNA primase
VKGVTSEVIADVRSRANLLEVISDHVVLKRTGKEYKGLCPFHAEKTPSFHVNPEKGIYKCFGCGEGGDVFAFIQKVKGLEFLDSVRELAHKYGVPLVETSEDREQYDRRTHLMMLYEQATEYYSHLLHDPKEGPAALQYLYNRGVTDEIIAKFRLGYAPNSWDGLLRYLTASGKVSPQTLEEAGLVRRRPDSTTCYDLFRHRLMIPICDDQARVIAFGGRTMGDDQIKYLNSPETPIYTKGQHLFAFHLAKDAIKEKDAVIVVEGYFDAITPHQYGFHNTVATLGTALTDRQAKLLVRYTESKRVYLSFDTDSAGERATTRGVETLNQIAEGIGIELKVIRVPGGKDPDECLRSSDGPAAFENAIRTAPLLIDYQLEKALSVVDLKTHTGRIEGARLIVPILAQIKNSVGRGEYIRQWAMRLTIREEELLSDVAQYRRQRGMGLQTPQARQTTAGNKASLKSGHEDGEKQLLALWLSSREDYETVRDAIADEDFIAPVHQRIKQAIEGIGSQFATIEDLQHHLRDRLAPDTEASKVLFELLWKVDEIRKQNAPVAVILKEVRARILLEKLNREMNRLKTSQASASDDEYEVASHKITQLKRLELLLRGVKSEEDLNDVKSKIDSVLLDDLKQLETSA